MSEKKVKKVNFFFFLSKKLPGRMDHDKLGCANASGGIRWVMRISATMSLRPSSSTPHSNEPCTMTLWRLVRICAAAPDGPIVPATNNVYAVQCCSSASMMECIGDYHGSRDAIEFEFDRRCTLLFHANKFFFFYFFKFFFLFFLFNSIITHLALGPVFA